MFKIRNIQVPEDYTDTELANALMACVVYTYGDNHRYCGADIVAALGEGEPDSGTIELSQSVVCDNADATFFVTDFSSGRLGIVPLNSSERTFVQGHSDLMADIATLLGYPEYVVFQYQPVGEGYRLRFCDLVPNYNWGTGTSNVIVEPGQRLTDASRGLYNVAGTALQMFARIDRGSGFGGIDQIVPNAIVHMNADQMRVPLGYYLTDLQNVQDVAMHAVRLNDADIDSQIEVVTAALGNMAGLVGALSVFGNSVKDVTDRYNSVTQYIPRP